MHVGRHKVKGKEKIRAVNRTMSDPFRRLFLDMLEQLLKKEPSRESMLELLQLATPGVEESSLYKGTEQRKLFRTLVARVHPDKHPKDVGRATRLCQDVKIFYDKCLTSLSTSPPGSRKKARTSYSPNSSAFPFEFNVSNKWPHIAFHTPRLAVGTTAELSCMVAYQCINSRGAIAHGKKIELVRRNKAKTHTSVRMIFDSYGGTKELGDIDDIKRELVTRGPVVSTSFRPSDGFLSANPTMGHQNDYLIIGWAQLPSGEVWLVQPLLRRGATISSPVHVAIGQFGIDECCLALTDNLENKSWEPGPYFDNDMHGAEEEWKTWSNINFPLNSLADLEPFMKEVGKIHTNAPPPHITIRNRKKIAHSRKARLRSFGWNKEKKKWQVDFDFIGV